MERTHGGDWAGFAETYGALPLDFSANTSPLGLPKGVREAALDALETADRYPDPLCRDLRRAIGQAYQVPAQWVLCGNGAVDLIERAVQAVRPKRALVTAPTFSEYANALYRVGCEVAEWSLTPQEGFRVTEGFLDQITERTDMVFLCEPNNPTGVATEPELLQAILRRCGRCGTLLVVDECFHGLLDQPEKHTLLPCLDGHRLLLLNAFTKQYAMAGLRLGFALCQDAALLQAMRQSGPPWAVSSVAQAAGIAALQDKEYPGKLRELLKTQRASLRDELSRLGATYISGEANYLFFYYPDTALAEKLQARGILIRSCGSYHGLTAGWYRIAVRTEPENRQLMQAMGQVMK